MCSYVPELLFKHVSVTTFCLKFFRALGMKRRKIHKHLLMINCKAIFGKTFLGYTYTFTIHQIGKQTSLLMR